MNKRLYFVAFVVYLAALAAGLQSGAVSSNLYTHMLWSLGAVELFLSVVFVFGQQLRRLDIIDAAWGPSFIVIALVSYFWQFGLSWAVSASLLYVVLTFLWGARLSSHIIARLRRTSEDKRYVELRSKWKGNVAVNTYFRVYMVQGALATLISLPVIYVATAGANDFSLWITLGSLVWLVGYAIEVVADTQLADFVSKPANRGKLLTTGLWKYSRNPNYFGELTMWWGIALIALASYPGWVGFGGAMLITYLIRHVSGVPLKEKALRKKLGWQEYVSNTWLLIPFPKRRVVQTKQ